MAETTAAARSRCKGGRAALERREGAGEAETRVPEEAGPVEACPSLAQKIWEKIPQKISPALTP